MIVDVVTYNGEKELFDMRYNILKDYVDEFIVVEFDKTFSGKRKEFWYSDAFIGWEKVSRHLMEEPSYEKYRDLAISSPNTEYGKGAEHWIREFCQKESIKDCLTHLKDDDIVFIGDCDEIWDKDALGFDGTNKLKLKVYSYYLNQRSSEDFWGTIIVPYLTIKENCLNHLRMIARKTITDYGWHFTSMANNLKQKLEDSYTKETYANEWVMQHLEDNVKNNKDFLGRDFEYWIDESDWPQYLKDNKDKYINLCKN